MSSKTFCFDQNQKPSTLNPTPYTKKLTRTRLSAARTHTHTHTHTRLSVQGGASLGREKDPRTSHTPASRRHRSPCAAFVGGRVRVCQCPRPAGCGWGRVEAGVRWAGRGVRGIDTCFFYPLANTEVIDIRDHEAVCQRLLRLRGGGGGGGGGV